MKRLFNFLLVFALFSQYNHGFSQKNSDPVKNGRGGFDYFIGIVGTPNISKTEIDWSDDRLKELKDLGVNVLQLSVAFGWKPDDEVLNPEDLYENPEQFKKWKYRVKQSGKFGFKTIAHFGIPRRINEDPILAACIMDPNVRKHYSELITKFMTDFPEINDILVYTYDQKAWICSEFGPCPRCTGIPIGDRLPGFLDMLNQSMQDAHPNEKTTLWWKPWEISKGQCIDILKNVNHKGFGIILNPSTYNEVYPLNDGSFSSDLGIKRFVQYAYKNNIPVIGEFQHTLYKPLYQVQDYFPRLIFEQLNEWKKMEGVVGVKEYWGFAPSTFSVNYNILKEWMDAPDASLDELLDKISNPYGKKTAPVMKEAWEYVAEATEVIPWDVSSALGDLGAGNVRYGKPEVHKWEPVTISNATFDTPIWEANRRAGFMMTDTKVAHPWIFEDVYLRLLDAADLNFKAVECYDKAISLDEKKVDVIKVQRDNIEVLAKMQKSRAIEIELTLACHLARTVSYNKPQYDLVCDRIRSLMQADITNGFAEAEIKLKQFNENPWNWLKSNFAPLTYESKAAPDWSKFISPQ